jgi:hypothetical protein
MGVNGGHIPPLIPKNSPYLGTNAPKCSYAPQQLVCHMQKNHCKAMNGDKSDESEATQFSDESEAMQKNHCKRIYVVFHRPFSELL